MPVFSRSRDGALGYVVGPVVEVERLLLGTATTSAALRGGVRLAGQDGERGAGHAPAPIALRKSPREILFSLPMTNLLVSSSYEASHATDTSSPISGLASSREFCW